MSSKADSRQAGIGAPAWLIHVFLLFAVSFLVLKYESSPQAEEHLFGLEGFIRDCYGIDNLFMYLAYATVFVLVVYAILSRKAGNDLFARRFLAVMLVMLAVSSLFTYFYLTRVVCNLNYVKEWDSYHYFFGAKYFDEVGYTRLYECTLVAVDEMGVNLKGLSKIRDLSTYDLVDADKAVAQTQCLSHFTRERWDGFKNDLRVFLAVRPSMWPIILQDHGYHGTPVHHFFADAIANSVELNYKNLLLLALVDVAALFIMFACVTKSFGWRMGLLYSILFAVNYPCRFVHIGGAFLRFVWMAFLVAGLCMLKEKRYSLSGILTAVSSMLLVFPALFAAGVGVKALTEYARTRKLRMEYRYYFSYFAVTCMILFILSISVGYGLQNWTEFKKQMDLNAYRLSYHRIGFKYNFMTDYLASNTDKLAELEGARAYYYAGMLSALAIIILLSGKLDDIEVSILFAFTFLFTYTVTVRYYYIIAAVLILFWHRRISGTAGFTGVILLFLMMGLIFHANKLVFEDNLLPGNNVTQNQAFMYNLVVTKLITLYLIYVLVYIVLKEKPIKIPPITVSVKLKP
ncbi:MAG: hypothetical protein ABH834_07205 [Candidatus Altiarchaeota archaeon]